jgi:hypothetical protein
MGGVVVTQHAAQRWSERVRPCSRDEAVAEIASHEKAIQAAAEFGAHAVKLPSRHRLVLDGVRVVTVLPEGRFA